MFPWNCPRLDMQLRFRAILGVLFLLVSSLLSAQTVATGSVIGFVADPNGNALSGAKISIKRIETNQGAEVKTNESGFYNSGPLLPGKYELQISSKGFNTFRQHVTVEVGNGVMSNAKMQAGEESKTVDLPAIDEHVHTEQPTVQGVMNKNEIETLLTNGREFADLGQLIPGVQLQTGEDVAPPKAGSTWISIGDRLGQTTRMEVDGTDVSDEVFGATTSDVPLSGIQEFQIGQSMLDLPTELGSSGAINLITRTGSNSIHGEAFGQFRDSSVLAAALPVPKGFSAPFQRTQYGGNVGGPLIKDKAFFFLDGERTLQYTHAAIPISVPFEPYSGAFEEPFREDNVLGRIDYTLPHDARAFYRFSYFKNNLDTSDDNGYSVYGNKDITRTHAIGVDFNRGKYMHSLRFSYLKFGNQITDATLGSSLPFANLGAQIFMGTTGLVAGPNPFAPQTSSQSNFEIKYDGGRVIGSHTIRYGIAYDRISAGGYDPYYLNGPSVASQVSLAEMSAAAAGPFPNGTANPLNYPADNVMVANEQGYSTGVSAAGFPAGGFGPDNRILLYLGDTWKASTTLTVTYGLRYNRDTSRTDSQFPAISQLNNLFPGLGNQVRQPNLNFGPQFGFNWDPSGRGTTSVRGGIGLFYDDALWNDLRYDAALRSPTGTFLQSVSPCSAPGVPNTIQTSNGPINLPGSATAVGVCGSGGGYPLIGNALPAVIALQQQWASNTSFNLHAANPNYVGTNLAGCTTPPSSPNFTGCYLQPGENLLNPNYQSPRTIDMNLGFQHELRPGTVFTVDVVREVQTHYLLGLDLNHSGDVRYFNPVGAQDAVTATLLNCGASSITAGWSTPCPSGRYLNNSGNPRPLNIGDFAAFGLGSATDMGGNNCPAGLASTFKAINTTYGDPTLINMFPNGYPCAFGGINSNAPPMNLLSSVGRSVYTGVQGKLVQSIQHPFHPAKSLDLEVTYTFSRFNDAGGAVPNDFPVTSANSNQGFIHAALDNVNPNRYFGPSALDRTHQVSFAGVMEVPGNVHFEVMSHFYSPLSATPTVPYTGLGAGEIFRTDFTGDGNTQSPVPGTHVGSFMHGIDNSSIHSTISTFNTNAVGQPTPAGHVLLQTTLFPEGVGDLVGLGAVGNGGVPLPAEPSGQVNMSWLKTLDASVGWTHTFFDRVTIKPSIAFFNAINFANFDLPNNMMSGLLTGMPGSINGTTYGSHVVNRAGAGSGLFTLGSPRQTEFRLKVEF